MKSSLPWIVAIALGTLAPACWKVVEAIQAAALSSEKTYEGSPLPRDQIAVLVRKDNGHAYIVEFDGRRVFRWEWEVGPMRPPAIPTADWPGRQNRSKAAPPT